MQACGRLYDNIRIEELGHLLGIEARRAEKMAARMITEGRLQASIDQVEGLLEFEDVGPVVSWDARIEAVCDDMQRCVDEIDQE